MAVLASPFMRCYDDHIVSEDVLSSPSMRYYDYLTLSKTVLASPFMRSHDDRTVYTAVLANPFIHYQDDLIFSKIVIAICSNRSFVELTVTKLFLRFLGRGRNADRTSFVRDGGIKLEKCKECIFGYRKLSNSFK
ncbi:hypothetical protein DPMN_071100 [Dreissena polymorpha]|uniref:Uncharacterized protein n=1 Tax=Dreissena polymorpha TaxID=45954 RepID=A0A9D3Z630_DREPO|nr:hypothetical protein DPMN_071100 [Dreissena polymorpha]